MKKLIVSIATAAAIAGTGMGVATATVAPTSHYTLCHHPKITYTVWDGVMKRQIWCLTK